MEKIKELVVHKPNQLIEIEGGYLTTLKYSVYNFLLHKFQNEKVNHMNIAGNEIFSSLEISKNYNDIIEYLDSLQKIRVVSRDIKGKLWGAFNLLSSFKRNDDGTFFIEIPHLIYTALCNEEPLYYTTIKLLEQKSFSCIYTGLFYEIFKKYERVNIPCYSLEILRKMTGTEDKYKEYKDFKRYVLEKSIKELNKSDEKHSYNFVEIKIGRKVAEIKFFKEVKAKVIDAEIVEETALSEKLLKAIKKAKKSLYLNKSYSDKTMKKLVSKYDETLIIRALEECSKYNQEIKSFSSLMTAKIEDIKNSSNEAIEKKLDEVVIPPKKRKKKITEDNMSDIFEIDENIEKLKKLLSKQAKEQGKFNEMSSSLIKACRTREDIEMVADNLKIELNLELF